MSLDCAEYVKDKIETFPLYHLSYRTVANPVNDAIVSAGYVSRARDLLEDYLLKNSPDPKFPDLFLPDEVDFRIKELGGNRAVREGVIYCSQTMSSSDDRTKIK